MTKSWKTTLGGVLAALGVFVLTQDWAIAEMLGAVLEGTGLLLMGANSRDKDVSSEDQAAAE